ncbi:MAG: hypothetical protein Fur005_34130 [Roseiflexaceae bacterium]
MHTAAWPPGPTRVVVDLGQISTNIQALRRLVHVPLMAVIKADAYGHGAVQVARTMQANGVAAFAVATIEEARCLRHAGIRAPILLLGYLPLGQCAAAVELDLHCTIFTRETADCLQAAAAAHGRIARVHLKVDTGMNRLGIPPEEAPTLLQYLHTCPALAVEGIYTHFSMADEPDPSFTLLQISRFATLLHQLTQAGLRPPIAHAANSAGLLRFPQAHLDMVRPGIACYGLDPAPVVPLPAGFAPALSFQSEVAQIKEVPPGTPISYGGLFVTQQRSSIATIPVGYADALPRTRSWQAVLVRGQRAPIVGRITMNYTMIDCTTIEGVQPGDPVVLIGAQQHERIAVEEVATWLGTISYEVVTTLPTRLPRVYREQ